MSTETNDMNIDMVLDFLVKNNIRQIEIDLDENPLWAKWTERHGTGTVVRKQTKGNWVSMPEQEENKWDGYFGMCPDENCCGGVVEGECDQCGTDFVEKV